MRRRHNLKQLTGTLVCQGSLL